MSLCWVHMPFCWFCHAPAHLISFIRQTFFFFFFVLSRPLFRSKANSPHPPPHHLPPSRNVFASIIVESCNYLKIHIHRWPHTGYRIYCWDLSSFFSCEMILQLCRPQQSFRCRHNSLLLVYLNDTT